MAITLLSTAPPALTSAELAEISATTPSTFEGIAPLLRHKEEQVEVTVDPAFEEFTGGKGELWITEGAVSFYSPSTSTGLSIPFPHLTLHAISRAPLRASSAATESGATDGGPCIYCQIDESEALEDSDEMEGDTREVIIVPSNPEALDKIFETLSACAALHPPPSSSSAGMFGGLDPDSMVYADADGNLVGPGVDGEEEDETEPSSAGRVRSDFVANTRKGPY
ncbi:regulator of volume decrease after cellular swelling-domain-containing protein [Leucosporidium creatinivorum]|uniref:Regulator of volume decrease after cellular swelling-domain-containing protein n=1 Tax=Leucosporidium creatinivorum TaxID=106004 RepID=A0A1Y2ES03_9BASI|nr:regulator of volume decrease after cellular swelling-domain-containing protein [Leucosporidium creatinivorum]